MIGVDRPNVRPRRTKAPGSESTFRVAFGDTPKVGDVLLFEKTGRRFRVLEVKQPGGRRIYPALRVRMLAPDAYTGDACVLTWTWAKRPTSRRLVNRPRLLSSSDAIAGELRKGAA